MTRCEHCGREIEWRGGRRKRFCCDAHRKAHARAGAKADSSRSGNVRLLPQSIHSAQNTNAVRWALKYNAARACGMTPEISGYLLAGMQFHVWRRPCPRYPLTPHDYWLDGREVACAAWHDPRFAAIVKTLSELSPATVESIGELEAA